MTPSPGTRERRSEVITAYVIGLLQGLSLVAFPASASIQQFPTCNDLSKSPAAPAAAPIVRIA